MRQFGVSARIVRDREEKEAQNRENAKKQKNKTGLQASFQELENTLT